MKAELQTRSSQTIFPSRRVVEPLGGHCSGLRWRYFNSAYIDQ
jgi:hypothetical protein